MQTLNVVDKAGSKQVGQVVSAKRGTLIMQCEIKNASGNTILLELIFPRIRFNKSLTQEARTASLVLTNILNSGWMTRGTLGAVSAMNFDTSFHG